MYLCILYTIMHIVEAYRQSSIMTCNLCGLFWTQQVDKWISNVFHFVSQRKRKPKSETTTKIQNSLSNVSVHLKIIRIHLATIKWTVAIANIRRNNGVRFRWCDERECALVFTFFMPNLLIFHFHPKNSVGDRREKRKKTIRKHRPQELQNATSTFVCATKKKKEKKTYRAAWKHQTSNGTLQTQKREQISLKREKLVSNKRSTIIWQFIFFPNISFRWHVTPCILLFDLIYSLLFFFFSSALFFDYNSRAAIYLITLCSMFVFSFFVLFYSYLPAQDTWLSNTSLSIRIRLFSYFIFFPLKFG